MFIEQPAVFLRWLYPTAIWRMSRSKKKVVYLTFDDGPIPEATRLCWTLDRFGVKATFLHGGRQRAQVSDIYRMVVERGHRVGDSYVQPHRRLPPFEQRISGECRQGQPALHTNLFRPPHGWMRLLQFKLLRKTYRIIM